MVKNYIFQFPELKMIYLICLLFDLWSKNAKYLLTEN